MSSTTTLRELIAQPGIIVAPGAYDCLTAKIIQQSGFPAVYMTGAGTSVARYGFPDLALTSMTEMIANASDITASVEIPVIADADTGYGGLLNVGRTVRKYEQSGVAAIHIEDQEFPKRCGHLDDKRVIPAKDMVPKIKEAVESRTDKDFLIIVRTDALAVTGWDDTMDRCNRYIDAGADVLFVEALRSPEEAQQAVESLSVPLLYNFVETGKSPLLSAGELEELGFKIVIFPASNLLLVTAMIQKLMGELREKGTTLGMMDQMVSLQECFELVGLSQMLSVDAKYQ
ncbi:MAG: isocitrate lyase/PEP mutase family protein [Chloroflexota bacterium]|nr:isocitrate lyase/PEP mutase family protein [Chloroflexota bacterium]